MQDLLVEKMMVLKFARRCREIDRQYEFNNNGDLDNGVYHKYANNTQGEEEDESSENKSKLMEDKELLNKPMLVSIEEEQKDSLYVNSFEKEINNLEEMEENQVKAKLLLEKSIIREEMKKNRNEGLDLDEELVKTYETF